MASHTFSCCSLVPNVVLVSWGFQPCSPPSWLPVAACSGRPTSCGLSDPGYPEGSPQELPDAPCPPPCHGHLAVSSSGYILVYRLGVGGAHSRMVRGVPSPTPLSYTWGAARAEAAQALPACDGW